VDNDGDLDLLLGNSGANRLYANDGAGNLTSAWISDEVQMTEGAAWGDWDGDGDLDLAVANHDQPNRLYENVGSTLSLTPIWASNQAERSWDLAWGDADNDGDLDLAVADFDHLRLYENTGGSLNPDPGCSTWLWAVVWARVRPILSSRTVAARSLRFLSGSLARPTIPGRWFGATGMATATSTWRQATTAPIGSTRTRARG
jgi:hypothetical protein